jgi:5-hydroxyisourate hydrolase-like protein (transthyretin family)
MIFQGTALRGDAPVAGVRIGLTRTEPGQEPLSVERETDEDGVIFATRLPTAAEASYELEVAHGEARVKLRW